MAKAKKHPELEAILNKVGVPYFIMATSHVLDTGYRHLTEENVKETIEAINAQDDSGKFMSNDFSVFILETAYEITQAASAMDLIKFASKHIN